MIFIRNRNEYRNITKTAKKNENENENSMQTSHQTHNTFRLFIRYSNTVIRHRMCFSEVQNAVISKPIQTLLLYLNVLPTSDKSGSSVNQKNV